MDAGSSTSRGRPTAASRVVTVALAALASALAVAVTWCAVDIARTVVQARSLAAHLQSAQAAAESQDWRGVLDDLDASASQARSVADGTVSWPWRIAEALPVLGPTARALEQMSLPLAQMLASADSITPIARRALDGEVRRPDGTIDLPAIEAAAPALVDLDERLRAGSHALASIDRRGVIEPLASAIPALQEATDRIRPAVSAAADTAGHLPTLLGADGPRTWLILLQNPAEARGAGGLVGGYLILRADEGAVQVVAAGTSTQLTRHRIPLAAADADARTTWGPVLSLWSGFNVSPDFALTARLATAGMAELGHKVDGVIAVDPFAVEALLAATGPVTAEGRTLTADDVADYYLVDEYVDEPNGRRRDEVGMALAQSAVSQALIGRLDLSAALPRLAAAAAGGRVRVWSSMPAEQEWLSGTPVSGLLPTDDVLVVGFNNAAGSKADAFVSTTAEYVVGTCPSGSAQSSLTLTLRNDMPMGLPTDNYGRKDLESGESAAPASTSLHVHVLAPVGAGLPDAELDGVPEDPYLDSLGDRVVWSTTVELPRERTRTLHFRFAAPPGPGRAALVASPMALPTQVSAREEIACR